MRSPNQDHAAQMHAAMRLRTSRRVAAYQALRQVGYSRSAAARVMGLTYRTVMSYEARLRGEEGRTVFQQAADRLEDYRWLRECGESRPGAAVRLGVSESTLARYEARLREAS